MKRLGFLLACGISLGLLPTGEAAEQFGPISVAPMTLTSGETHHGYREYRIVLENQSPKDTHEVTLIYPDRSFDYGNSIGRITRQVTLGPGTRAAVPIWQPPLPQSGSGRMRVVIRGEEGGFVNLPPNTHMNRASGSYSGAIVPATVLVSRSVNYDELSRALKAESKAFTALMATGAPDSRGSRGVVPSAWSPDHSSGGPHWLELDYDTPIRPDRLRIYDSMGASYVGDVVLTGISGTNLPPIPLYGTSTRPGVPKELTFPVTAEAIKTVRINLGSTYPGMISIDSVELEGPGGAGRVWASAARASSEHGPGAAYGSGPAHPGRNANELLRSEVAVTEWSENWLSYSAFDGVAIAARDFLWMPPAVQTALWRYTECGGNLVIFGDSKIPTPWSDFPKAELEGGQSIDAGFGRCYVFNSERVPEVSETSLKKVAEAVAATGRIWQQLPDEGSANAGFSVVENIKIPVRGIVVIMLAFVIVIGPVNIIYLSRTNRRTWLLWTIPAISLVTSLLVFAYSFLREGVTPDVRIEGFTYLDQVNHRAATMGMTAFYCPLTPSGGLYLGSDTEATPLVGNWDYRRGTSREMDWTRGQHLERGWVTARVPAHFQLRKSETRRERLQLERSGAELLAVNGLGAGIHSLWLADSSGRIYTAANVPAGQKAKLTLSARTAWRRPANPVQALSQKIGFTEIRDQLATNAVDYLMPNSYIADLDANPFLENGLGARGKSARVKARSVVYGRLETNPQP